ncbi:methylmalonyl-CoA epimerase [Bacillaceae bacterium]
MEIREREADVRGVRPPKKIDHIGIAVKDLQAAVKFYTEQLGLKLLGFDTVESEHVRVAFLEIGETRLELLEGTSPESAIAKHIEKRGEGLHHIALQVDDIEERLARLQRNEVRLIHEKPKAGAHDSLIAFLHPKAAFGVLLELCQPRKPAE